MRIKCGPWNLEYPDKWPKPPKPAEWFSGFMRIRCKKTGKPVVMEIRSDEVEAVVQAVRLLGRRWSVEYANHPVIGGTGWLRCRFCPPGAKADGALFTDREQRDGAFVSQCAHARLRKAHSGAGAGRAAKYKALIPEAERKVMDYLKRNPGQLTQARKSVAKDMKLSLRWMVTHKIGK